MINKKNLWCSKCNKFPDRIIEEYLEPIEEIRIWNGNDYALHDSDIADIEFKQLCGTCRSKLVFKNGK